jgi:superfamily II DNA or RNA helicase
LIEVLVMARVINPLEGCVLSEDSPWRGLIRVAWAASLGELPDLPGFLKVEGSTNQQQNGWFVPKNLVEMGTRPQDLLGFEPEKHDTTPSGLKLDDHQLRSVTFLRQVDDGWGGALLGAEPGLGKTMVALHAAWLDGFLHGPGLVIAPLKARSSWCGPRSDPTKHYQLQIFPLETTQADPKAFSAGQWFFIHHDVLAAWMPTIFQHLRPALVICDESHDLMNPGARRTKQALELSKAACIRRRYLLSGTPVPKGRMDLWSQLAIAQPFQWSVHQHAYGMRYAGGERETFEDGGGHFVYQGRTNTEELRARLQGVYLRYNKRQVKQTLPELERRIVRLSPGDIDLHSYWDAQINLAKYIKRKDTPDKVVIGGKEVEVPGETKPPPRQIMELNTLICLLEKAKADIAIRKVCEATSEFDKIVVFAWQREVAKTITLGLRALATSNFPAEWVVGPIDGGQPQPEREKLACEFGDLQRGIAVCTRGAAGASMNELNSAQCVMQTGPDWNPSGNIQVESRVHRKGCPHQKVISIYLVADNTVDDMFMLKLAAKADEAANLADTDTEGRSLVRDLAPDLDGPGDDVDGMLKALADLEDDD